VEGLDLTIAGGGEPGFIVASQPFGSVVEVTNRGVPAAEPEGQVQPFSFFLSFFLDGFNDSLSLFFDLLSLLGLLWRGFLHDHDQALMNIAEDETALLLFHQDREPLALFSFGLEGRPFGKLLEDGTHDVGLFADIRLLGRHPELDPAAPDGHRPD
jgi:hypothetical protein